jgi:hypothetical protein
LPAAEQDYFHFWLSPLAVTLPGNFLWIWFKKAMLEQKSSDTKDKLEWQISSVRNIQKRILPIREIEDPKHRELLTL